MENLFTSTGTRTHSVSLPVQHLGSYTYYLRAKDIYGNETAGSAVVQFSVDTTKELVPWYSFAYDYSSWKKGLSPLGNDGAGSTATIIDTAQTAYFAQKISITNIAGISQLKINVVGHDGAVAYLNGYEVGRVNIEQGSEVQYSTTSLQPLSLNSVLTLTGRTGLKYLREGENLFAFEVHPWSKIKKGILFDAKIADQSDNVLYALGSEWHYFDNLTSPENQIIEKSVNSVESDNAAFVPERISLHQNFPNPFNPTTNIAFDIVRNSYVTLNVYNVLGQLVETVAKGELNSGRHTFRFNGRNVSSGIFFYNLSVTEPNGKTYTETKSMMMIK